MSLVRICEVVEFGGDHAAVAELGLSLTCEANCMCPLTGGFSMKGVSE